MRYPPPIMPREARVRRDYAHFYEEWGVRAWTPAATVADLLRSRPRTGQQPGGHPRLPDNEFEFRGGTPRRPGLRARTRRSD